MVVLEWPNCLNGKSFLRGWGRGMTNFQLCGSGNWERMIPWWRLKRGDFASVTSSSEKDCLAHIWGGSNLITIEVSNLQGPVLTPVYIALFHSSLTPDIWHHDVSHASHPLSPVTGAHRYREHESENKPLSRPDHSSRPGAISKEFRANGTLNCAKKLNTNPVHRTQHSDRGQIIQTQGLN